MDDKTPKKRRSHRHDEPHVYDPMETARILESLCGKLRARADLSRPDETRTEREIYQDMMYYLAQEAEQHAISLVRYFILTRARSARPALSSLGKNDKPDENDDTVDIVY